MSGRKINFGAGPAKIPDEVSVVFCDGPSVDDDEIMLPTLLGFQDPASDGASPINLDKAWKTAFVANSCKRKSVSFPIQIHSVSGFAQST